MEHKLSKSELRYLKSLLSRMKKFKVGLADETVLEEIKTLKDIYKRKYINTNTELDGILGELYDDEVDLINSWKSWYEHTTMLLKMIK